MLIDMYMCVYMYDYMYVGMFYGNLKKAPQREPTEMRSPPFLVFSFPLPAWTVNVMAGKSSSNELVLKMDVKRSTMPQ